MARSRDNLDSAARHISCDLGHDFGRLNNVLFTRNELDRNTCREVGEALASGR
jgi:hypothetical protein